MKSSFKKYTSSEIHWKLIELTRPVRENDRTEDGWCPIQALFCPYYVTLEGSLGSDWGVIVNPDSAKFGQVVFEHEDCGCPAVMGDQGWYALHGEGSQEVDEWHVASCYATHRFKDGSVGVCLRPKNHRGKHLQDHGVRREWR